MNDALTISGLTKNYKDFKLNGISFSVPCGSIVGLIGENGAGKSTTIYSILGIVVKDAGTVTILGKEEQKIDNAVRNQIGVVFDGGSFPDTLTAKKLNNIFKSVYTEWDENQFFSLLTKLSLPADKKIKEFSKGMKMKYALTLALSHNAELLIMDEPTSGLDPLSRSQLLNVLNDYMENGGKGVLFSTHITSDLDKIADMLIMIHNGRIVFQEEKDFLLDNYRIIKGDKKLLTENIRQLFLNITETAFGFTGVTRHAARVQSYLPDAITERPTIEDIMLANLGGCGK